MVKRGGLVSFSCVVLAVVLVGPWLFTCRTQTVVVFEPIDPAVFDRIVLRSFSRREAALLRQALLAKFTGRCTQAFRKAGLRSPWETAWESGIVIQYSRDLYLQRAEDLGLVYTATRDGYRSQFSTGRAQAGTVPFVRNDTVLTTDGRPHIFIHDSAFFGESLWLGTLSLTDVLTHELIHAGGQPPTPGWLDFLDHDLAGFGPYDEIIEACR